MVSSNGGKDMGSVLWTLGQLGYGWAYRCLDAQYFGLAQQRQRVFIVGCLGNAGRAAQVLFESESVQGDTAKGFKAGEEIAQTLGGCSSGGGFRNDLDTHGAYIVNKVARCVTTGHGKRNDYETEDFVVHTLTGEGHDASEDGIGRGIPLTVTKSSVRRLTPLECLRLQGFPDDWLDLNPPIPNSQKYKMIGNAVAVPVIEWIGKRMLEY